MTTLYLISSLLVLVLLCLLLLLMHRRRRHTEPYKKGSLTVRELDTLDGIAFEKLICEILYENDFEFAENTPSSHDFGVDILARRDGMTYAIQCKRYLEPVGIDAIQQVYAGRAFYECHVAVVLTNQSFTSSAITLADKIGVVLWDREVLRNLLGNCETLIL